MENMYMLLFFLVSSLASVVGAICGIGGGVIIKPVLDMLGLADVSTISFLSGCTVLSMSLYSVAHSVFSKERKVDIALGTPLAIGAALGGIVGKMMFTGIKSLFYNSNIIGSIQAACLLVLTIGTLLYTFYKDKISTKKLTGWVPCVSIGLLLGISSSFLGIGGGPINLIVLHYFFGMATKIAAANSLYIIVFSQIANLLASIATGTVPQFNFSDLIVMIIGGIVGGVVGRLIGKKITSKTTDKLFIFLMLVIIGICIFNIIQFS